MTDVQLQALRTFSIRGPLMPLAVALVLPSCCAGRQTLRPSSMPSVKYPGMEAAPIACMEAQACAALLLCFFCLLNTTLLFFNC